MAEPIWHEDNRAGSFYAVLGEGVLMLWARTSGVWEVRTHRSQQAEHGTAADLEAAMAAAIAAAARLMAGAAEELRELQGPLDAPTNWEAVYWREAQRLDRIFRAAGVVTDDLGYPLDEAEAATIALLKGRNA